MSDFAARIDRFVRWFFNVSPMEVLVEPQTSRRPRPLQVKRPTRREPA
ncbi:MAG: hypothetical protein ABIQ06_07250 [Caldimonas sp.]